MGNFRSQGRGGGFGGSRSGGRGFSGGRGGGRTGGFGGGRDFNRGERRTEMHDATCGKCGKPCQVPFKPFGDKPVFCRNCFGNESPRSNFITSAAGSGASAEQFAQINAKLDKIILILQDLELEVEVDEDAEESKRGEEADELEDEAEEVA